MAGTIKGVPDESKWSSVDIEAVKTSLYDSHKSKEPWGRIPRSPSSSSDADQQKKKPAGRKFTSRVRTSEFMDTQLDAQDSTMREDMVLAEQPTSIQRHAEPE